MNISQITKYCEQKLDQAYADSLDLASPYAHASDSWIYYAKDQTSPLDALYIFPHTGLELPAEFGDWYNLSDDQAVADSILDNHDIGSRSVMNALLHDLQTANYNYGIMFYKFTRVATDANRLELAEQMVDRPYRGIGIWNKQLDKHAVAVKTTNPWFEQIAQVVKTQSPKLVFHFHTMDTYGGGVASSGHEVSHGEKRPHAMICKHYNFDNRAYGAYGPDAALDFELMSEMQIAETIALCKDSFSTFVDEPLEIGVDYPYKSPRMISGFIRQFSNCPQLVIDFRKDLFSSGSQQIAGLCHKISVDF